MHLLRRRNNVQSSAVRLRSCSLVLKRDRLSTGNRDGRFRTPTPEAEDASLRRCQEARLQGAAAGCRGHRTGADTSEYGFDSITFTSLTNELNAAFGFDITPAVLFEYRTLEVFIDFLCREHGDKLVARYTPEEKSSSSRGMTFETPSESTGAAGWQTGGQ